MSQENHSILIPLSEYKSIGRLKAEIIDLECKLNTEKENKTFYMRLYGVYAPYKSKYIRLINFSLKNPLRIVNEDLRYVTKQIEEIINEENRNESYFNQFSISSSKYEIITFNNKTQKRLFEKLKNENEELEIIKEKINKLPKIVRWLFKIKRF